MEKAARAHESRKPVAVVSFAETMLIVFTDADSRDLKAIVRISPSANPMSNVDFLNAIAVDVL
jgi:hypothetical protein